MTNYTGFLKKTQQSEGYTLENGVFLTLKFKDKVVKRYPGGDITTVDQIRHDADQHLEESRNGIEFCRV